MYIMGTTIVKWIIKILPTIWLLDVNELSLKELDNRQMIIWAKDDERESN
jgi:hypothetical protein